MRRVSVEVGELVRLGVVELDPLGVVDLADALDLIGLGGQTVGSERPARRVGSVAAPLRRSSRWACRRGGVTVGEVVASAAAEEEKDTVAKAAAAEPETAAEAALAEATRAARA